MQSLSESDPGLTVVEHYTHSEASSGGGLEPAESAEVTTGHRGGRLDLHAGQLPGAAFENNVDLGAILVSEVANRRCQSVYPSEIYVLGDFRHLVLELERPGFEV